MATKTNLSFGDALNACINDNVKIAREGWNGKGMFVFLVSMSEFNTKADISEYMNAHKEDGVDVNDCLAMKAADDSLVIGWLASQSDLLANDWMILE